MKHLSLSQLIPYIKIARPDHWFKNFFLLPGMALALFFNDSFPGLLAICMGIVSTCLSASANYCINEWLDAPFDRLHPSKANRPAACGLVTRGGYL